MNPTLNSLEIQYRRQLANIFNFLLAQCLDLQLQAKQAHWNVKGPNFIAVHEFFDNVPQDVEDTVDLIAERVAQLGGTAMGTIQDVCKTSELPAYPTNITSSKDHLSHLSKAMAQVGKKLKEAIPQVTKLGDDAGVDILIQSCRAFDKSLWFVESHLQG